MLESKFPFSQRTINVRNKVSTECVHASSVNMFKNKIGEYLVKATIYKISSDAQHLQLIKLHHFKLKQFKLI